MKHKYEKIVQVGDRVKFANGTADYFVKQINSCGEKCLLIRNNEFEMEYKDSNLANLVVLTKNQKLCSHKEIEKRTLNKEYREKTNPHKKVQGYMTKPKTEKQLDYLVTVFAPLVSVKSEAGINDNIYSREVITGKKALADYILVLDSASVKHLREVRVLGREVKIDIKREVVIK